MGNENDRAYVKNVAMLDCEIRGQQNVGGIAGVTYGTITGCVVTGHVWVDDLSNSHTSGGIAGKVKEGEGPHHRPCGKLLCECQAGSAL